MSTFSGLAIACLVIASTTGSTVGQVGHADVLNRVMKKTSFDRKSLPEVARLMGEAAGVTVKLSPEIQTCIAQKERGCDWQISGDWGGGSLESALWQLTDSAGLDYKVTGSNTVLIVAHSVKKPDAH